MNVENIIELKRFGSDCDFREGDVIHQWKVDWGLYNHSPLIESSYPRRVDMRLPDYVEAYDLDDMLVFIDLEKIPDLIKFLQMEMKKYEGEE